MMCYVYEWHVEALGIIPLNYAFVLFFVYLFATGSLAGLETHQVV